MALIDELREQLETVESELAGYHADIRKIGTTIERLERQRWDLDTAIAALEPPAEVAPEPEPEPQEIETSSQSEPFVSWPAETELQPLPGGVEESRDYSDDASEFSEEGYAPVIDPEPSPLIDAQTCEPINPHPEPETPADPLWNEPEPTKSAVILELIASGEHSYDEVAAIAYPEEPTKPEADSIAKALDYYNPKAVAERERRNPFNIFKREGDQ